MLSAQNELELGFVAQVGRALWADPQTGMRSVSDTWSAVALLDLTADRRVNRATRALIELSGRLGNPDVGHHEEFFQIPPTGRFLLVAAYLGRWSYARSGEVLGLSAEDAEGLLWQARMSLADLSSYPAGSKSADLHCPDYDVRRPWTQRFLDQQIAAGRDLAFLKMHLDQCETCRNALKRCRELIYAVEVKIPPPIRDVTQSEFFRQLKRVDLEGRGFRAPLDRSFMDTMRIFLRRLDVRIALGLGAAALLALALRH